MCIDCIFDKHKPHDFHPLDKARSLLRDSVEDKLIELHKLRDISQDRRVFLSTLLTTLSSEQSTVLASLQSLIFDIMKIVESTGQGVERAIRADTDERAKEIEAKVILLEEGDRRRNQVFERASQWEYMGDIDFLMNYKGLQEEIDQMVIKQKNFLKKDKDSFLKPESSKMTHIVKKGIDDLLEKIVNLLKDEKNLNKPTVSSPATKQSPHAKNKAVSPTTTSIYAEVLKTNTIKSPPQQQAPRATLPVTNYNSQPSASNRNRASYQPGQSPTRPQSKLEEIRLQKKLGSVNTMQSSPPGPNVADAFLTSAMASIKLTPELAKVDISQSEFMENPAASSGQGQTLDRAKSTTHYFEERDDGPKKTDRDSWDKRNLLKAKRAASPDCRRSLEGPYSKMEGEQDIQCADIKRSPTILSEARNQKLSKKSSENPSLLEKPLDSKLQPQISSNPSHKLLTTKNPPGTTSPTFLPEPHTPLDSDRRGSLTEDFKADESKQKDAGNAKEPMQPSAHFVEKGSGGVVLVDLLAKSRGENISGANSTVLQWKKNKMIIIEDGKQIYKLTINEGKKIKIAADLKELESVRDFETVVLQNKLYFLGGRKLPPASDPLLSLYSLDLKDKVVTKLADMKYVKPKCVVFTDKKYLYSLGGYYPEENHFSALASSRAAMSLKKTHFERYNPEDNTWTELASPDMPFSPFLVLNDKNNICVFPANESVGYFMRYGLKEEKWSKEESRSILMQVLSCSGVARGKEILLAKGADPIKADIYKFLPGLGSLETVNLEELMPGNILFLPIVKPVPRDGLTSYSPLVGSSIRDRVFGGSVLNYGGSTIGGGFSSFHRK